MDKTISLNLEITPQDYVNATGFLKSRSFLSKYSFIIFPLIVFFSFVLIICWMSNNIREINVLGLLLVSAIPALLLWVAILVLNSFSPFLHSRRVKKIINSSPFMQGEVQMNFTDEGIEFLRELVSSKINWRAFTKAIESDRQFLLYYSDKESPIFIPKRAFVSNEEINFVRCLVRAKLGDKAEL